MKVVPDTMIWVSYCTLEDGYSRRVVEKARKKRVRFFVSQYILEELASTMIEDLALSKRFVLRARRKVLEIARSIELPQFVPAFVPGDPSDNPVVLTAITSKADYLVTWDKEILKLRKIRDVEILTPSEWEKWLGP